MAKTDWQYNDVVTETDMNELGEEINELSAKIETSDMITADIKNGANIVQGGNVPTPAMLETTGRTLVNMLGSKGACDSITGFTAHASHSITLDSGSKGDNGANSIKVTANASNVGVYVRTPVIGGISADKNYLLIAYINNASMSGNIKLRGVINSGANAITSQFLSAIGMGNKGITATLISSSDMVAVGFQSNFQVDIYTQETTIQSGQYAFIDSIRIYEVGSVEYAALTTMTAVQIAERYPYLDTGIYGVTNPTITSVQDNLFPPINEWRNGRPDGTTFDFTSVEIVGSYEAKLTRASASAMLTVELTLEPNTEYTLGSVGGSWYVYESGNYATAILSSGGGTFKTTDKSRYIIGFYKATGMGDTYTFKNPTLIKGTTAAFEFKPQRKTSITAYTELYGSSEITDKLFFENGLKKFKCFGKLLLDGSYPWLYHSSGTGYKIATVAELAPTYSFEGSDVNDNLLTKFDGTPLIRKNSASDLTSADIYNNLSSGAVRISIANTDSGWGDSYTPTADEIKAYFNGWIMYVSGTGGNGKSGITPYNGTGTKYWAKVGSDGNTLLEGTIVVPTTKNKNLPSYQLLYLLANPTIEDIPTSGTVVIDNGENYVSASTTYVPVGQVNLRYAKSFYSALEVLERKLARGTASSPTFISPVFFQKPKGNSHTDIYLNDDRGNKVGALAHYEPDDIVFIRKYANDGSIASDLIFNELKFQYRQGNTRYDVWHVGNNTASLSATGYQKLASGFIIQYGTVASVPTNTAMAITFPIAFPNSCRTFTATVNASNDVTANAVVNGVSATGANIYQSSSASRSVHWIAIGY